MKPLDLANLSRASHNVERAYYRTGEDDAVARDHSLIAIVQLARARGLGEREVQAIRAILLAHENGAESAYDAAKRDGLVVEERVAP